MATFGQSYDGAYRLRIVENGCIIEVNGHTFVYTSLKAALKAIETAEKEKE